MTSKGIDSVLSKQVEQLLKVWKDGVGTKEKDAAVEAVLGTSRIVAPVVEIIGDVLNFEVDGIEVDKRVVVVGGIIEGVDLIGSILNPFNFCTSSTGFCNDLVITDKDLFLLRRDEVGSHKAYRVESARQLSDFCTNINYPKMVTNLLTMVMRATNGHIKRNRKIQGKIKLIRLAIEAANSVLKQPKKGYGPDPTCLLPKTMKC